MPDLPARWQMDPAPTSLVSGARVGLLTGLAGGTLLGLQIASPLAGLYLLAVAFLVGGVGGPLVSFASRSQSRRSAVPITFSAMGTLAGVLLLPMLAAAVPPDLGLTCLTGVPFLVTWGTPFWVLLGGPLGALVGMLAGLLTERGLHPPGDPLRRPTRVALATGLLTALVLAPLLSPALGTGLQMAAWKLLGAPAGWTALFLVATARAYGPVTLGLLAALGAFGAAMLLETREEWDRRRVRPFLPPTSSFMALPDGP